MTRTDEVLIAITIYAAIGMVTCAVCHLASEDGLPDDARPGVLLFWPAVWTFAAMVGVWRLFWWPVATLRARMERRREALAAVDAWLGGAS